MMPHFKVTRYPIFLFLIAILSGCTLGGPTWGPSDFASIQGTIIDESGQPVSQEVTITIGRTVLQTSDGSYAVSWLSPGKYVISASSPGYDNYNRIITVQPGKETSFDIVLSTRGTHIPHDPQLSGTRPLQGKTIVVDPGHGGFNPNLGDFGTVGQYEKEKTNVLAVGLYLRDLLEAAGANVIMTRETDVNPSIGTRFENNRHGQLQARVDLANRIGADAYVSIHNDWHSDSSISGTKTFYYTEDDRILASYVQPAVVRQLGSKDRGIDWASFQVIRETHMPSVLIELAFLSNPREDHLMSTDEYRRKSARGLYEGLLEYFRNVR